MRIPAPVLHFHRLLRVFLRDFLPWYFFKKPIEILKMYGEYAKTFSGIFSIVFLLKTLVSPWKSIGEDYPENMLQLGRVIQAFTMNCTARGVGLVVRTGTIVIALCIQILLLAFFLLYFVVWILFPLLVPFGVYIIMLLTFA